MSNLKIIDKLDRYLTDNQYKIIIKDNTINIINYTEIKDFTSTKIVIKHQKGITTVLGTDLVVSKMQDNETLIIGNIQSIEL